MKSKSIFANAVVTLFILIVFAAFFTTPQGYWLVAQSRNYWGNFNADSVSTDYIQTSNTAALNVITVLDTVNFVAAAIILADSVAATDTVGMDVGTLCRVLRVGALYTDLYYHGDSTWTMLTHKAHPANPQ